MKTSNTKAHFGRQRLSQSIFSGLYGTASCLLMLGVMTTSAHAAESCSVLSDDLTTLISNFDKDSHKLEDDVEKDYTDATSKNYFKTFIDNLDTLNNKAKQASDLVNQAYDLTGFTPVFNVGDVQKKMPPVVTHTMSNAVEIAQAVMNEENTKLDLADLRCSQSTEDTALSLFLDQAKDDTRKTYQSAKYNACKVVHILADIQDKREKLNDIRQNGYPLFYLHAKDKKSFAGLSRTIQFKVDLRMFPEYPDKAMGVDGQDQPILLGQIEGVRLSYNTYFKWSDDNWTKLNLYQYLISDTRKDDYVCAPYIHLTNSVKATFCAQVEALKSDNIKLKTKAKFQYKGDTKSVSMGSVTVPAPFGYLSDLADMKEDKMEKLRSKVAKNISSHFDAFEQVQAKAEKWKSACSS